MHVTLRPGFVYLMWSPNRPAEIKIGLSEHPDERLFDLALADPSLQLFAKFGFLDAEGAEAAMHGTFETKRIDRETFKVSRTAALKELKRLSENDQTVISRLHPRLRMCVDLGVLDLTAPSAQPANSALAGTAYGELLAHVPVMKDGRSVRELVNVALSRHPMALDAIKLLARVGLLAYPSDRLVLLDRRKGSALERVFKNKACRHTWRAQLERYAGIRENGQAVAVSAWLDVTEAGPELVHTVMPSF